MSTDSHSAMAAELADERQESARLREVLIHIEDRAHNATGGAPRTHYGQTAQDWCEQYEMLRDAFDQRLGQFLHDDDAAEVAIYIEGVERLGCALAAVKLGDEGYEGPVEWGRYHTKERAG